MKNLIDVLHLEVPDYDPIHGLAVCDFINQRIANPIRDIERGRLPKEDAIKILQIALESELIPRSFFMDSMRRINNISPRTLQVTR